MVRLQQKRKLIIGANFVTFVYAVNAMVRTIQRYVLSDSTQNYLMSFCYVLIIRRTDYRAEIEVPILPFYVFVSSALDWEPGLLILKSNIKTQISSGTKSILFEQHTARLLVLDSS